MNRDIKFRAKVNGSYVFSDSYVNLAFYFDATSGYEQERFTGEIDKNGVDVFESDIVRIKEAERNYIIKFQNGCFKLFHADPKLNDMLWGTIERVSDLGWNIEVIGNIYENKEILNK